MSMRQKPSVWWGPPRKFNPSVENRKISWLELFYDLVYVIVISRITYRLGQNLGFFALMEYTALFALIFWGWLNGSLYHDLHGNAGLRTRLMTLWQMMIVAALAVTIGNESEFIGTATIVVMMVMQLFITYQWWSVGLYDKEHRKYNIPYTIFYLLAFGLLAFCLLWPQANSVFIVPAVIVLNYLPPFISSHLLKRHSLDLHLSSSMTERLGLFTIIVFGEVVLGVVNGMNGVNSLNSLLCFTLSITIVFALWWLFFTLISNRNAKRGFVLATLLELLYVPTLVSLGVVAASFSRLLVVEVTGGLALMFGCAAGAFLACIALMMGMLEYPAAINPIKRRVRISLFLDSCMLGVVAMFANTLPVVYYLLLTLLLLLMEVYYLNSLYYGLNLDNINES